MRVRMFFNKSGLRFRLVQVSDVVTVVAQGAGEVARWDDRAGFGLVLMIDGDTQRFTDHERWAEKVKSTAALMGVR